MKMAVRDCWTDNKESPVYKALKELMDVLGLDVQVEVDWQLLATELDAEYPDKGDLVAAVVGTVETWTKTATELLLDEDKNAEWTENLLERLNKSTHDNSGLHLFVQVSRDDQASTSWSEDQGGFVISLPQRHLSHPAEELFALFKCEIRDCCFDGSSSGGGGSQLPPYTTSPRMSGDEWADHLSSLANTRPTASSPTAKAPEFFPRADAMPRPDDLLNKPPYHLFVYAHSAHEIEIQGSHSGTLKFLAEYFKKWRRVNHQLSSKPPAVEVKLHNSAFGLGAIIDRLMLVAENRSGTFTVTATIVLSLVEGVLGYRPVYSEAHSWTYRRDIEFKSM